MNDIEYMGKKYKFQDGDFVEYSEHSTFILLVGVVLMSASFFIIPLSILGALPLFIFGGIMVYMSSKVYNIGDVVEKPEGALTPFLVHSAHYMSTHNMSSESWSALLSLYMAIHQGYGVEEKKRIVEGYIMEHHYCGKVVHPDGQIIVEEVA